jgi:hypothetical protein
MTRSRKAVGVLALLLTTLTTLPGQTPQGPLGQISPPVLREWLTYLASDELEGRATFSEGLGLAAAYISDRLREAGVKPAGDGGSYFQRVSVLGVQSANRSTLTVEVAGQSRTFADGTGVTFPRNVGGRQTLVLSDIEFVGYGLNASSSHNDYARDVKGKAVLWLGQSAPSDVDPQAAGRLMANRTSVAVEEMGAAATISPMTGGGARGNAAGQRGGNAADFTTSQRLDLPRPPSVSVSDEVLEFIFSASGMAYPELKLKADRREALPTATIRGVKLTFDLDASYRIVNTRYTRNVVGIVEGSDPQLRDTYVAFGAHYDHVGYSQGVLPPAQSDRISNGADDDGSGSSALIGIARAFAAAPKTKRSLLFVWHAGEELGLYGSRYLADYPPVPIDSIVAQLNMDMIGRNRDNRSSEERTVLAVGADRISTDLHNILIDVNAALPSPLTIDFEMNDPMDPERIYYRSDHYSYAAKGIPVIFFFTGLHPDYHQVSDHADRILYDKVSQIARLVYETGRRLADSDRAPARDFRGPRMGRGSSGRLGN